MPPRIFRPSGSIKHTGKAYLHGSHPTRRNDCEDRRFLTVELRELVSSLDSIGIAAEQGRARQRERERSQSLRDEINRRPVDVAVSVLSFQLRTASEHPFERFVKEKFRQGRPESLISRK